MSNISKRPPEESNHPSPSARHPHEDSGSFPSMKFETGQDSRAGKASRSETRDVDKRSPLHSAYRISESHVGHMILGTENRLESRDSKDGRENKVDSRDTKAEPRELYHQASKLDKDGKFQVRVDDTKEAKHNRETGSDLKSDSKAEKDLYGSGSGLVNWKDHHKGKRHADAGFGNSDWRLWGITKEHSHGTADVSKEGPNNSEREQVQIGENTGEMKSDFKGDDKYKDRDRKRKEGKHRDWGERDKVDHKDSLSAPPAGYAYKELARELREEREGAERDKVDHRDSVSVLPSGSTYKELAREEREGERWEKDKKVIPKEKDRSKDREKDFANREVWNSVEKESSHYEKEIVDRSSEQGNAALDQKRPREGDVGRNTDKEARERRKEPDGDVDGERPEKRSRFADKESDEWVGDAEAGAEQEKEGFTSAIQQKKRMLRPRGSPHVTNREQRLKPHGSDGDGLQGKSEAPTIVYKVGECLQGLFKAWKDYASSQTDKSGESSLGGPTIEVKIPGEHVTATNRQVRGGQLWGTDVYTDDSDLVAVLMHMGYCRTTPNPPPPALQEVRVIIRVLPPLDYYVSSLRNNVRSRAWGAGIECSYRVERCFLVKKGCEPREIERSLSYSSTIEPTLAPVAVERTMTTRAAASNALRQQRFVREVTLQYNLSNEPWIKYTINVVADKGLKKPMFTSARLKKGEVLYMETHFNRYELCFMAEKVVKAGSTAPAHETETEKSQNHHNSHAANGERGAADGETVDVFRFSRCKKNLPQGVMRQRGIPLPSDLLEVLEDNLDWEDVLWSQTGVWIRGKSYHLARVHFMSPN